MQCKSQTYNYSCNYELCFRDINRKGQCDADGEMNKIFKFLASKENDTVRPKTLTIRGRNVTFEKTCGQVADCTFEELCDRVRLISNVQTIRKVCKPYQKALICYSYL